MKNVCYIISGIDTALAFEWINEALDKNKFNLHFILLHNRFGGFEEYLNKNKAQYIRIGYSKKSDLLSAILKTYLYLKKNRIDIVHCHLLDAGLVGIISARLANINTRIYTRHYSSYHHVYYPKGVLYDKIINRYSTKVVAISKVVEEVLVKKEYIDPSKIETIYHGFPLNHFAGYDTNKIEKLKEKYKLKEKWPVIGVIARHTKWKGVQYIIPAFQNILTRYPNSFLFLANAKGEYHNTISGLLACLPKSSFTEVVFEEELFSLYHCFDIFVHAPIDNHSEAFGQVYVEAMAAGIPSVFTISGIGNELVIEKENAIVADYANSESIYNGITLLLENPELCKHISEKSKMSVSEDFKLETMISRLTELYE